MPIFAPTGQIVPLASVCRVENVLAPQEIDHIEKQRSVKLQVKPPAGVPLGEVIRVIEEEMIAPMRADGLELMSPPDR